VRAALRLMPRENESARAAGEVASVHGDPNDLEFAMFENVTNTVSTYLSFYGQFFLQQWSTMTPMKYGALLLAVGVFGWVLMKSSQKS